MWDLRIAHPFGRISTRKFLIVVAALVVTTFAYLFLASPTAHAADADWNGAAVTYSGNQYVSAPDAKAGDGTGLPAGTHLYVYVDPASTSPQKAHVIYFPAGADPSKATSAQYADYNFTPPDHFSNQSGVKTISITPSPSATASKGTTSCDSTFTFGVGWIVCPITNFLSSAMDWLFGILSDFLTVRPVQTTQDNALYRAWSFMRNFANVAFVIAFMIIIYSQLTSFGLSNYGIKRLLPRLIIAAVLVNISYWICAVAIDLSNILGYSLQEIFITLRNHLVGGEGNSWDIVSWKSIGGFILSGGTAAVAGGIAGYALLAGTVGGALYLLLPILVGALMAVLVALLIMAARQAIVTIMVILSPLAFVAYLLPNTEKYFDRWKDLFLTMLIMFPAFSVIFGGAQLAGVAIIQNADSINTLLLGMAVQVAPVAITPLLLKFSGSLLGRIAGMVNNPNRGLVDRTRKWSQERANQHKARVLANPGTRRRDALGRVARNIDHRRRAREGWQKANEAFADANWENTHAAHDIHFASHRAALMKEVGENEAQARFEAAKLTSAELQDLEVNARASKLRTDLSKARVEANWEELKAGDARSTVTPAGLSVAALANYMHDRNNLAQDLHDTTIDTRVESQRQRAAQHIQTQQFASELDTNATLRQVAGGIDINGAVKAHAAAVSELAKTRSEEVEAGVKLLNARALQTGTTLKNLTRDIVTNATAGTATYSPGELEAALDAQAQDGQIVNLENARMSAHIDQDMLSRVFARNAGKLKEKGGFHLQNDPTLALQPLSVIQAARAASLGDTASSYLKDLKVGWVQEVSNNIGDIIANANAQDLQKAYDTVFIALTNPDIRATVTDRVTELQNIEEALRLHGITPTPPTR